MKKTKMNKVIEYLAPILILSYFFTHNIIQVLIGITFSLYLININSINNLKKSINKNLFNKKENKEPNKKDKDINSDIINIEIIEEDTKLTLVEEIEEFGFIPSINKKKDENAA